MQAAKDSCLSAIDSAAGELNGISQQIWSNPELGFEEHQAHRLLVEVFRRHGFTVEEHFHLATAFRAVYGDQESQGPNIAVMCEYDALPKIGHACGHNLIAEVGVAVALGVQAAMKTTKTPLGKLTVLGTPAEEGGGGKIYLIEAGALDTVDVAMMAHPFSENFSRVPFFANNRLMISFHGKASHAAAFPWEGVNALDAAVMFYQAVSNLRQMKPTWRVHGVITNGGTKPNIIPDYSELLYYVRTVSVSDLTLLTEKVKKCAEAAATATGCQVEFKCPDNQKPYKSLLTNASMASLYENHMALLGVIVEPGAHLPAGGSTDMGNVSHVVPSIHPEFDINTDHPIHSVLFQQAAGTPAAQENTLRAAKALALTALDIYLDKQILEQIKLDFINDTKST